ncbi:MAG: DUF4442 domain-containing protein [Schleiferiaceae bacterium]
MSLYQKLSIWGPKLFSKAWVFKNGFNWSPMYRRSTGKIVFVSEDLRDIRVEIPLNWKNRNYANSMFGGSMFSSVDPIPMVQLLNIIGKDYVVWDKSAEIQFKRPAKEKLYAHFVFTEEEIQNIHETLSHKNEMELPKTTLLTNATGEVIFCEVSKVLYIAKKEYYKAKRAKRTQSEPKRSS